MRALITLSILLAPMLARADETPAVEATNKPPTLRMSLEADPADYTIYGGWGAFIGIHPAATGAWRFRVGGGVAKLPDVAVQNSDNNDGWHQKLDPVVTIAAHRYFGDHRGGFFLGGVAGYSSLTFTAPSGGTVDVHNVVLGVDAGYRWFPSDKLGLVITPHLGALIPIYKDREPVVGMDKYDLLPVIPMPQLLVGYELDVLK